MDKLYISSYTEHESLAHMPKGKCAKSPLLFLGKSLDYRQIYNPAFMIKHPKTNRIYDTFYICLESIQTGHIAVISDNKLKQIVKCGGKSSCFLAFDPTLKYMININYWDSSISIHNINSENYLLSEPIYIFKNNERIQPVGLESHLKNRQSESHYHSALFLEIRNNTYLLVPDLGLDKIHIFNFIYHENGIPELILESSIPLTPGSGPRYIVMKGSFVYVVNELNSTVSIFEIFGPPPLSNNLYLCRTRLSLPNSSNINTKLRCGPSGNNKNIRKPRPFLKHRNTISTLPPNISIENNKCGGITLHKTQPYLLVSNRGHNSISVFKFKGSNIQIINTFSTFGMTPRHFTFDDTCSNIYVANQDSDNICRFSFKDGMAKFIKSIYVSSPNFILT